MVTVNIDGIVNRIFNDYKEGASFIPYFLKLYYKSEDIVFLLHNSTNVSDKLLEGIELNLFKFDRFITINNQRTKEYNETLIEFLDYYFNYNDKNIAINYSKYYREFLDNYYSIIAMLKKDNLVTAETWEILKLENI